MEDWQKMVVLKAKNFTDISWDDIGAIVELNPETCRKFYTRECNKKDLPTKVVHSKNQKITARVGLELKKTQTENPKISLRKLSGVINEKCRVSLSAEAIRKYFEKQAWIVTEMAYRIPLTLENKMKRVEFAKIYQGGSDILERVLWSDETSITVIPQHRKITVRVHQTCRSAELPFLPKDQNGGFSVMFWGCFSRHVKGPLIVVESMNAKKFLELVKKKVKPLLDGSDEDLIFMQDSAPSHNAKSILNYFDQNGIEYLEWPPQSPDLNPIENIWGYIKRKLDTQENIPSSKNDLVARVTQIWEEIDMEMFERLADSVSKRLGIVVKHKGGWIK